jgi:hypothetical protein
MSLNMKWCSRIGLGRRLGRAGRERGRGRNDGGASRGPRGRSADRLAGLAGRVPSTIDYNDPRPVPGIGPDGARRFPDAAGTMGACSGPENQREPTSRPGTISRPSPSARRSWPRARTPRHARGNPPVGALDPPGLRLRTWCSLWRGRRCPLPSSRGGLGDGDARSSPGVEAKPKAPSSHLSPGSRTGRAESAPQTEVFYHSLVETIPR